MPENFKPKITFFHCINSLVETEPVQEKGGDEYEAIFIKLPCSGMVKDVFLLRALESGSDAVVVLACPEAECRYLEGNLRAVKRINWVKNLLDEIGLDARRLSLFNLSSGNGSEVSKILKETLSTLKEIGPNPAA